MTLFLLLYFAMALAGRRIKSNRFFISGRLDLEEFASESLDCLLSDIRDEMKPSLLQGTKGFVELDLVDDATDFC